MNHRPSSPRFNRHNRWLAAHRSGSIFFERPHPAMAIFLASLAGLCILVLTLPQPTAAETSEPLSRASETTSPGLSEILERIENRYAVSGFSARFIQQSVLKAMDMADMANGVIYIKRPGKMRWEYREPERQTIVSDGFQLWIYRPEDNQVMVGKAPAFFSDGQGASFLADVGKMRQNFEISLEDRPDTDDHILKLIPRTRGVDLSKIYLTISWASFNVQEIVIFNAYGDETRILLDQVVFDEPLDDHLFQFTVPKGVEVLQLTQ